MYLQIDQSARRLPDIMATLYYSLLGSDVTFALENGAKFVKAHRAILGSQSPVFAAMLLGNKSFKETTSGNTPILLPKKSAEAFELLVRYLYIGKIDAQLDVDNILELLCMAHEYQISTLVTDVLDILEENLSWKNVFQVSEVAEFLNEQRLLDACNGFVSVNVPDMLNTDELLFAMPKSLLCDILSRDNIVARELDILLAIYRWNEANIKRSVAEDAADVGIKDLLKMVRFGEIKHFDGVPFPVFASVLQMLSENGIDFTEFPDRVKKGPRNPFQLVASEDLVEHASVELVDCGTGKTSPPSTGRYAKMFEVPLSHDHPFALLMTFQRCAIVNSLKFAYSCSGGCGGCGYFVETSCNKRDWQLLADCTQVRCDSKQLLIFAPRRIRYVRISHQKRVPTSQERMVYHHFDVGSFECPLLHANASYQKVLNEFNKRYPDGLGTILYQEEGHSKPVNFFDVVPNGHPDLLPIEMNNRVAHHEHDHYGSTIMF